MNEPKQLSDIITRYQALTDLRETWALGVGACNRVQPQYRGKADEVLLKSLTTALELLDRHIDLLSGFDMKKFTLMRTLNDLPTADKIPDTPREEFNRDRRKEKDAAVPTTVAGSDGVVRLGGLGEILPSDGLDAN